MAYENTLKSLTGPSIPRPHPHPVSLPLELATLLPKAVLHLSALQPTAPIPINSTASRAAYSTVNPSHSRCLPRFRGAPPPSRPHILSVRPQKPPWTPASPLCPHSFHSDSDPVLRDSVPGDAGSRRALPSASQTVVPNLTRAAHRKEAPGTNRHATPLCRPPRRLREAASNTP